MNEFEKYEQDCERIRTHNAILLEEFEQWLFVAGLTERTVTKHVHNIDFYSNIFLLTEEAIEAREGFDYVDEFLGYWFIRKALWASESSIRANAASLKKFYAFLLERGGIEKSDYHVLKGMIKEGMDDWLVTLRRFDDPLIEDVWGFL